MRDPALPGLASDFRNQLIIDRYSSVLSRLPLRRQAAMAGAGSRSAEIWNVFRTLAQLDPSLWLPRLLAVGRLRLPFAASDLEAGVGLTLWKRIKPPPERLAWLQKRALSGQARPPVGRRQKGRVIPLSALRDNLRERARRKVPLEDPLEVDVIVKTRDWIVLVEIPGPEEAPDEPTASDRDRTRILRLIDAGLSYAEGRSRALRQPIRFALLVLPMGELAGEAWTSALRRFTASPLRLRRALPHRAGGFDPRRTLGNVGSGSWSAVDQLLHSLRRDASDDFEAVLLDRLLRYRESAGSPAAS